MIESNNFQQLLAEEERRFEDSGIAEAIQRKMEFRFAFLRLAGDLAELFTNRLFDVAIMMSADGTEPGMYFRSAVLEDLKAEIAEMIERDLETAVNKLESLIHRSSGKYEELLSVKKQLSNHSPERIMMEAERGQISQRLQNLIDSLDRSDFR